MTKRMIWKQLLSTKRVADYTKCEAKILNSQYSAPRSPFEKDFDQITFSYPFRRLQDKTQVIPFPKFDFVHTRLTHSLEVASVGRSFGKLAADLIFEELDDKTLKNLNICPSDIGALIAAACLAHDIGNDHLVILEKTQYHTISYKMIIISKLNSNKKKVNFLRLNIVTTEKRRTQSR